MDAIEQDGRDAQGKVGGGVQSQHALSGVPASGHLATQKLCRPHWGVLPEASSYRHGGLLNPFPPLLFGVSETGTWLLSCFCSRLALSGDQSSQGHLLGTKDIPITRKFQGIRSSTSGVGGQGPSVRTKEAPAPLSFRKAEGF